MYFYIQKMFLNLANHMKVEKKTAEVLFGCFSTIRYWFQLMHHMKSVSKSLYSLVTKVAGRGFKRRDLPYCKQSNLNRTSFSLIRFKNVSPTFFGKVRLIVLCSEEESPKFLFGLGLSSCPIFFALFFETTY